MAGEMNPSGGTYFVGPSNTTLHSTVQVNSGCLWSIVRSPAVELYIAKSMRLVSCRKEDEPTFSLAPPRVLISRLILPEPRDKSHSLPYVYNSSLRSPQVSSG